MPEEEKVKLVGFWPSPFVYRVIWGLKMKGVAYEYVEEDIFDRSPLLNQLNPLHGKVPVLVHGGKAPICESLVILHYLDEAWPQLPRLLPEGDLYQKATARFWMHYGDLKYPLFKSLLGIRTKEEGVKGVAEATQVLKILEEQALGDKKFFGGDAVGMVDLAFGWLTHWRSGLEEMMGIHVLDPTAFPRLHAWSERFLQVPVIKENLPPRPQMLAYLRRLRDNYDSLSW